MFSKSSLVILSVVVVPSLITNCYLYWKNRHNEQKPRKYIWGIVVNALLAVFLLIADICEL